jgi:cell division protein FtsI (penicillin-binding protein 3)
VRLADSPLLIRALSAWRARLLLLLLLGGFVVLLGRSLYLQGIRHDFLQQQGESRYSRVLDIPATRGRIVDRHGEVLAMSAPVKSIWAIPEDAHLTPAQARQLAALLDVDVREMQRKLASEREFVYLKRQIAPELAERVVALKLPGIHEQREYRRYYPAGDVTAHVLGFTGVDGDGQEGIELAYENTLAGRPGSRRVIRDNHGDIVEDVESIKSPQDGKDVVLSIDGKIQYLAYAALKRGIADSGAKAGGIVVLDAKTGEVLALANLPTYNPNNRVGLVGGQLRNRALTDTFEPGSTMKPFTAALALDQGTVRFDTPIQTAPGRLNIDGRTIHDAHKEGVLTVAQVIQKSSNIGAAKIALSLPPTEMWQMFDGLGFGNPLGLGFPGEVSGRLRPVKTWRPIEQATMAYGHGISVTLMQLAHAYLVFAREGDLVPLTLTRLDAPPLAGKQMFSADTARQVRTMLQMVVEPGGTAPKARIAGYQVAGKTGTAYKAENGSYAAHKYVASFVGFAPANDPRLVVAVMLDEPAGEKHQGGEVAAPLFAEVMAGGLRSLGLPPDNSVKPLLVANAPAVKEDM